LKRGDSTGDLERISQLSNREKSPNAKVLLQASQTKASEASHPQIACLQQRTLRCSREEPSPIVRLCNCLEFFEADGQKAPHVGRKEQVLGQSAEGPEGSAILEDVSHQSATVRWLKIVIVVEVSERAAHHAVAKVPWPVKRRDPTGQMLPDAQMARPPGNLIAEREEALCSGANGRFASGSGGSNMCVDAAREIKTPRRWSGDQ
jgi:hypothetical protein